jgi:hypothetical protein
MNLAGDSFGSVIQLIFNNNMVRFALALLGADVLSGIGISLYQKTFKLGAMADFLWSRALPYFLGAGALQLVVMSIPPDYPIGGIDSNLTTIIWGFVVAALIGQLLDNLRQMGLPIPEIMTSKKAPETKTTLAILLPFILSAGLMGCTNNASPKGTPERQVALYGIQVGKYLAEVKTSADDLYAKQLLPRPAYEQVLRGLVKVNGAGEQLGAALKAYDAAITDEARGSVVGQIDAALLALQAALPAVVPEGLPLEVASRISKGVVEVQRLMLTIARFTAPAGASRSYINWPRGSNDLVTA